MSQEAFDSWAIVELMGHVKVAGRVTEEERFGAPPVTPPIQASEGEMADDREEVEF